MARIEVHPKELVIRLTAAEKTIAMHRRDIVLSRDAISSALITDDPWVWLRGVRAPGTHVPGRIAFGTWRALGGRDFVAVRNRKPAVVIDFELPDDVEDEEGWVGEHDQYSRVIISTNHAAELIRALRLDGDDDAVFSAAD